MTVDPILSQMVTGGVPRSFRPSDLPSGGMPCPLTMHHPAAVDHVPLLLDVTRLISRSWTRRRSTGIDRVCYAYLRHFASRALAVVQHRGVVRVLNPAFSGTLFDLLLADAASFRPRMAAFAPRALATGCIDVAGATYLNVSHTDFDLASHARWVRRNALRPVYLLHDLIPLTHGHHCRPRAVQRHRGRVIGALRHGAGIVVSSKAVAHDLTMFVRQQRLGTPSVLVAPLAGETLRPAVKPAIRSDYFLCVGTIESRKNHILLLDVWRRLRARLGKAAPRLIIVGQWGVGAQAVRDMLARDHGLMDHVSLVEGCSDDRLADLMSGARAMLMPTLAEGFGLPMAEALALGVPVIASDLPCFHEVGQGVPCLLDPSDPHAWADLIAGFDDTHPERCRQIDRVRHYRPTTWSDHFSRIDQWLPTLTVDPDDAYMPYTSKPAVAAHSPMENVL